MYRVEWIRHQEREKKKLEDEKEKERGLFNIRKLITGGTAWSELWSCEWGVLFELYICLF